MGRVTITSRLVRWVTVMLLASVTMSGCRGEPKEGGPFARRVRETVPKIERATGLTFKRPPVIESRSKDDVRRFVAQQITDPRAARELDGTERLYKRLGMLPDSLDVRKLLAALLEEQIVGYYDPATGKLYVVEGAADEMVGIVVTHELVHALQDQYINLDSIQKAEGDDDRKLAAQAVFEGQATLEQMQIMVGSDIAAAIPGGWERIRQEIREQQSAMPVFAGAPLVIQESLIFPYLSGAEFMRRFEERRSGASVFGAMPTSSEQILHAESYFGSPPDLPTRVEIAGLRAGTTQYATTMGEFATRLFLYVHLRDQTRAVRGAIGWDGDRIAIVDLPGGGEGLVWVSVWDSPVDAAEFNDLLREVAETRFGTARASLPSGRRYEGSGRSVIVSTAEVDGRPLVIWSDVPAGVSADLVDVARIRLAQP